MYACLLLWPGNTTEITLGAPVTSAVTRVTLLGSTLGPLGWQATSVKGGMTIDVTKVKIYSLASEWAWVFKLEGLNSQEEMIEY